MTSPAEQAQRERGDREGATRVLNAGLAALRLIAPDHITPVGTRMVTAALREAARERPDGS